MRRVLTRCRATGITHTQLITCLLLACCFLFSVFLSQCGYVAGYAARFLTRVGVFLVVGSSLGLYALQKQGIIVVQMDRIYAIGREVVRENKGMVDEALEKGNRALSGRLQQLVELLTATTHGIGFSAGFLLAFK